MRWVTILGSPRESGNTATVLGWIEEELEALGHAVERINLTTQEIGGCTGCWACGEAVDEPGCILFDDAQAVFERMIGADGIVFSSPLYMWGFASQMKALLDRCACLVKGYGGADILSLVAGRRAALLVTCAGPVEENADLIVAAYRRFTEYTLLTPAGELVVSGCGEPDQLTEDVEERAVRFARGIVA
jgi:NAD(P)H-dependent FMN reductase